MTVLSPQAVVPQDWDSADSPPHVDPPFCAGCSTNLDLSWVAPPHVAEQVFQGVQELHMQLTEMRDCVMCDILRKGITIVKQLLRSKTDTVLDNFEHY